MKLTIYYINESDIERSGTLERSDIGRAYIILNGCIQFVQDNPKGYFEL